MYPLPLVLTPLGVPSDVCRPATSICSNDILSSCFYTIGLVTSYSGKLVRPIFSPPSSP